MTEIRKPRVVIDARMAGAQGHGIGLYVQQLAEGLAKLELSYEPFYLIPPDCPRESGLRQQAHAESRIPFLHPKELILLGREIRRFSPDLFHSPSFSSLFRYPCPHLQTVHDLNHLQFGNTPQKAYYRFVLLPSLISARAVCSVSSNAALEIKGWLADYGVERTIALAPNAVAEFPVRDDSAVLRRFGLEKKNFFYALANAKPHKNLEFLQRAYSQASSKKALPPLVLTIPGVSTQGLVHTGPLEPYEVGALLRGARACFSPSLYEGFGRPPVEAALTGTLPVVSSIPVHREVLSGVTETIYLNPFEETQWRDAFLELSDTAPEVGELSREWVRKAWSIERLAEKMNQVYLECLSS